MAKIGLITILYNSNDVLEGFFKSLAAQTFTDYHLYICDNAPSFQNDNFLYELIRKYPISSYSHIKSETNLGFAKANNIGIKAAIADGCSYLLITNNDIEFDQNDLLYVMINTAEERGEFLLTTKILFYNTRKVWMAGGYFIWWKAMGLHKGEWLNDKVEYDVPAYCNYAPLCFMLIKSTVFEKVGLLDEKYFVYFEDTDFIYRSVQKGYKIYYMPQLKILHKVGSSTGGYDSLFSIFYGNRNRIYFIRKQFTFFKKVIALAFVLSTRLIKYYRYDTNQRKELVKAIKSGFLMSLD